VRVNNTNIKDIIYLTKTKTEIDTDTIDFTDIHTYLVFKSPAVAFVLSLRFDIMYCGYNNN